MFMCEQGVVYLCLLKEDRVVSLASAEKLQAELWWVRICIFLSKMSVCAQHSPQLYECTSHRTAIQIIVFHEAIWANSVLNLQMAYAGLLIC